MTETTITSLAWAFVFGVVGVAWAAAFACRRETKVTVTLPSDRRS